MDYKFTVDNRSGEELQRLMDKHSIKSSRLAKMLGVHRCMMSKWLNNKVRINRFVWVVLLVVFREINIDDAFDITCL